MSEYHSLGNIITNAIKEKRIIEFDYDGYHRIAEPHVYGTVGGKHELLIYQIVGRSSSGRLPDWRRMKLKKITNLMFTGQYFEGKRESSSGIHSSFDRRFAIVN
ncbi:MAG TPA: hypothetical protein VJ697_15945 [Nitrososphaeraceae archaeon]|nr:hypothetical protein [Nitrososphaeraceae archaeon]